MENKSKVLEVMNAYREQLLALPNVIGVGLGYKISGGEQTDELCIVVLVRQKKPLIALETSDVVPQSLDGILTDVREIGDVRTMQSPKTMWRPAFPGVSLGHYQITSGTFGCVVYDRGDNRKLILSNNHVLANNNEAVFGDAILQPGPFDGGTLELHGIASLERFIPLQFNTQPSTCKIVDFFVKVMNLLAQTIGSTHVLEAKKVHVEASNLVDAAVARPYQDDLIEDSILTIGEIDGISAAELNMPVRKFGRSTGFTTGVVTVIEATVNVNYGDEKIARFDDQILTTPMSEGGDSGSLLVTQNASFAVGLLFAGSDQISIHNPIQKVLELLNINFRDNEVL